MTELDHDGENASTRSTVDAIDDERSPMHPRFERETAHTDAGGAVVVDEEMEHRAVMQIRIFDATLPEVQRAQQVLGIPGATLP